MDFSALLSPEAFLGGLVTLVVRDLVRRAFDVARVYVFGDAGRPNGRAVGGKLSCCDRREIAAIVVDAVLRDGKLLRKVGDGVRLSCPAECPVASAVSKGSEEGN